MEKLILLVASLTFCIGGIGFMVKGVTTIYKAVKKQSKTEVISPNKTYHSTK